MRTFRNLIASLALAVLAATPALGAPKVVATFLPVHGIVAAVMRGIAEPDLLIDTPVSPHTYALTPSKRRLLDNADLVIGIGPGMEVGIWDAIEQLDANHVALMDFVDPDLIHAEQEATHELQGDDGIEPDAHEDDHDADEHEHDHGGANPHIWLDTAIAAGLADNIAQVLSDRDPENAATYHANAVAFQETMHGVDAGIGAALAGHVDTLAISYHDAFHWFALQLGFRYGYVVLEPDMAPSAARVANIRDRAAAGEVACLMTEPQFRPDLFEALAADFDLPVVEIDPVGNDIAPGPDFYPELMRRVGNAFATCLGR